VVLVLAWLAATRAVDLHVEALSADQLSISVTGQTAGSTSAPISAAIAGGVPRAIQGVVVTNDVRDASSLGQAAMSIALHARLTIEPRAAR
jgi:hypothetical protein